MSLKKLPAGIFIYVWYRDQSTRKRRKFNLRLKSHSRSGVTGKDEDACPIGRFGSSITRSIRYVFELSNDDVVGHVRRPEMVAAALSSRILLVTLYFVR